MAVASLGGTETYACDPPLGRVLVTLIEDPRFLTDSPLD